MSRDTGGRGSQTMNVNEGDQTPRVVVAGCSFDGFSPLAPIINAVAASITIV